jgi:hypothetical protein
MIVGDGISKSTQLMASFSSIPEQTLDRRMIKWLNIALAKR